MTLKVIIIHSSFLSFFDILRRKATVSECHPVFFMVSDITSEIKRSDVAFNVACELS